MNVISGGTTSSTNYWMYDITNSANQHQAKVVLPASYILEWENTVSTLSANQMGQGGVGLVSGTNKIVAFAGHGDWHGTKIAAQREIIHETGSLVRYNGYTQGESAYQTKKAASSETKIPYKIRVANNDVAVTINNQLACTFTKTTAISKLAILAGTYGGYPFVTYFGISNLRVRAYSAAPPAALTFNGEQENPAPPVTTFTASPTAGLAPVAVQFTDTSAGGPTSWSWTFGDGNTSTAQNPQHTYITAGAHTVTLTASHPYDSDTETKTSYITIAVLQPFPGLSLIPTDLTGNGLYTDINGNNRLDYNDLTTFFLNLAWARDNEPTECFDFNQNGRLDYADVIALFQVIKNA